jgi:hypothetical protein
MKKLLVVFCLLFALCGSSVAQNITLSAPVVIQGSAPILGATTVNLPTDASVTIGATQYVNFIRVTSSVSLTAKRSIILPQTFGQTFSIENNTTGAQPILAIGASGTGVTIANGATAIVNYDGTNYVNPLGSGGGGGSSASPQYAIQGSDGAGGFVAMGISGSSNGHVLTDSTAGYFSNTFNTNGGNWHVGLAMNTGTPTIPTTTFGSSGNYELGQNGLFAGIFGWNIVSHFIGDDNSVINAYKNGRHGNANGSDEGTYLNAVAHDYFCENDPKYCNMYKATITGVSQPTANGPAALTLSQSGYPSPATGQRMTADTLLIDETSPITANVTFTAGTSLSAPLTMTISSPSVTIPVSISGTLNADTTWTPASYLDVAPVLTTFAITTSGAQSNPGDELCIADSNAAISNPGTPIVSASKTGSTETITAYLMKPHYAGAQINIGGLCGYAIELTNDTHNGQKYAFEIYGTPTSTTASVGSRSVFASGGYQTFGVSGPAKIYPAARIATTSATVNTAPTGLFAQIIPPPTAIGTSGTFTPFATGAVVSNPGFPAQIFKINQKSFTIDDPYAVQQGQFEQYVGFGQNWTGARWHLSLPEAGNGGTPPVILQADGVVSSLIDLEHQVTGTGNGPQGLGGCSGGAAALVCISSWDDVNGPGTNYVFLAGSPGDGDIQFIRNAQTVTSCSISGTTMTLNGSFNHLSYIIPGRYLFIRNFVDGAGGCSDFNSTGNLYNLYILTASSSVITVAVPSHATYAGTGNAGNSYTSQFELHGGQSSIDGYLLSGIRVEQNGNQVCDSSGTVAGCSSSSGVTSFATGSFPSWLTPTVTNGTTTPSLAVAASAIPNTALANSTMTLNGTACSLGATCTVSSSGTTVFSALSSATNTTAAMVVGTGSSLSTSGTGTIAATSVPFTGVTGVATVAQLPTSIPNTNLANPATTVNGQTCTLGATCTITAAPATEVRAYQLAVASGGVAYFNGATPYSTQQPQAGAVAPATSSLGYVAFNAAATNPQYLEFTVQPPPYWTGSDAAITFFASAVTGNVTWELQTACPQFNVAPGAPTFTSPQPITTAVSTTTNGLVSTTILTNIAAPTVNSCTAGTTTLGTPLTIRLFRANGGTDTAASDADAISIVLLTHRSQ